jgi:hypothetical protein
LFFLTPISKAFWCSIRLWMFLLLLLLQRQLRRVLLLLQRQLRRVLLLLQRQPRRLLLLPL